MMMLVLVTVAPSQYNKCSHRQVYQLLEEMLDYGFPLTTEPNALKDMIRPPTIMSELLFLQSRNVVVNNLCVSDVCCFFFVCHHRPCNFEAGFH